MGSSIICSDISSTKITDIHPEIIATHILTRIDVLSVASAAMSWRQFHALCTQEKVWTEICNSTWTSTKHPLIKNAISTFPAGHYSFFSDSFPVLHSNNPNNHIMHMAEQLISAVDIKYRNKTVYSQVDVTNTSTQHFLDSIFKLQVVVDDNNNNKSLSIPIIISSEEMYLSDLKENMTLSWIMIDSSSTSSDDQKRPPRAANISSQRPISVRPHWIDGDIEVKYANIVMYELVEIRITAMLKWGDSQKKSLKLSKVKLQLHDMDSMCLDGEQSLRILQEAIQTGTRKKAKEGSYSQQIQTHQKFLDIKWERRHGKQTKITKLLLIGTIFVAFIIVLACLRFLRY